MTTNELEKIIDWVNKKANIHKHDVYEDDTGNFAIIPAVHFDELMALLGQYPVEEPEECCEPNYESMYIEQLGKNQDLIKKNKELKQDVQLLEHKLACAKGAIAMVETIYGRKWAPSYLEMIR